MIAIIAGINLIVVLNSVGRRVSKTQIMMLMYITAFLIILTFFKIC